MIVAGRSFDAKAQEEELKTPTLPLVGFFGKFKHLIIDLISPDLDHAQKSGGSCCHGD